MKPNIQKNMGLGYVMLAGIFLFNPIVAFADVLPDCIGYCLLCIGLSALADLNGHIAAALRRFRILILIGVGQIVASYLIYQTFERFAKDQPTRINAYESSTLILLGSFVLLFLQWYFLIPALRELFIGLDSAAQKYGSRDLYIGKRGGKNVFERMSGFSTAFVICMSLLSVLPEASLLTSFEDDIGWYRFVSLFRIGAVTVSLILGTVWLIRWVSCFRKLKKDELFLPQARADYQGEILPQTGMLTVRRIATAFAFFNIGIVFAAGLRLNYHTALPGIVFAILVAVGVFLLGELLVYRRTCWICCAALAVSSVAQLAVNSQYLKWYLPEASLHYPEAYWKFLAVRILDGIEAILTLVLITVLLRMLYGLVKTQTEVLYGAPGSEVLSQTATRKLHREFQKRMTLIFWLFFFAAAVTVLEAIFRLVLPWLWVIAFIFSFSGIWQFFSMMHELTVHIHFKYGSDGVNKNI